ncbi:hypothetical protein NHX12_030869 [Muraenolepis orangiensis]|uniref:Uridylate-specific endoribonuclease n=1 Tax=Muraenolepis orangiensis TaxID=630683 RepID=A0A9Q0ECX1_9TELE|nr:hypothetical protein NHX12_030869 [Muraenolepis orangiensis]
MQKITLFLTLLVALFCQGHSNTLDLCNGCCSYGTDSNLSCEEFSDCCTDYADLCKAASSCQGRCDEKYNSQNKCHCNSKCSKYDNCCSDYTSICGGDGGGSGSSISDSEIRAISEVLYTLDSNKASASELVLDTQALVPDSQTSAQKDLSPRPLFRYLDEEALFSRPTYAAFLSVLDNYQRMTGQNEDFSPQQLAEQEAFVRKTMSNTELGRELYAFLFTKGEIKGGKISGFHNWIQFYLLEKQGLLNYYSHSFNGPWTTYPDSLGLQFRWDGYYKQVGSAIIGCSPEFDFAMYSLCYITRPGKRCSLSLGGKTMVIQTYTWDKSSYGDGKKFIGSAFPASP